MSSYLHSSLSQPPQNTFPVLQALNNMSRNQVTANTKNVLKGHSAPINQLSFSHCSKYLASIADDGCMLIYSTSLGSGALIRRYIGEHLHCALVWHPQRPCIITSASNGEIVSTLLADSVCEDVQNVRKVPGFIHVLAYNADGSTLAVAYGDKIGILSVEGKTSELRLILDSPLDDSYAQLPNMAAYAQSIIFTNFEDIVVTYASHGIVCYSAVTGHARWRIAQRYIGCAAAYSSTTSLLAVTNIFGNAEWFSLDPTKECFLKEMVVPETQSKQVTGIVNIPVVSGDLIAIGSAEGAVYFARYQEDGTQGKVELTHNQAIQAMACMNIAGEVLLAIGLFSTRGVPQISVYTLSGLYDDTPAVLASVMSVIHTLLEVARERMRLGKQLHLVAHPPQQMLRYVLHSPDLDAKNESQSDQILQTMLTEWQQVKAMVRESSIVRKGIRLAREAIRPAQQVEGAKQHQEDGNSNHPGIEKGKEPNTTIDKVGFAFLAVVLLLYFVVYVVSWFRLLLV